jgi:hypothetical protein
LVLTPKDGPHTKRLAPCDRRTVEEAPRYDANIDNYDEYHVHTMMVASMEPHIHAHYQNHNPFAMVGALKTFFAPQVRRMSYECLSEFLTTKMEENTCFEIHLTNMHRVHRRLIDELNYLMTDELTIDVVFLSHSPSYKEFIKSYVITGYDDITFYQCIVQLKHLKVDPIAGEVIDLAGIFDIQCYKYFINTYCSFKYMIIVPVFWKT